ncbi:MAG: FkbM family methyltransferase [Verrucomicrobiota bacterium]
MSDKRSFRQFIETPLEIEEHLLKLFSPEESLVFFEAGACEGEHTLRYAKVFPNAKIYAFEPLPANILRLKSHLADFDVQNVEIIENAVSNQEGVQTFYVSTEKEGHFPESEDWNYGNKSSSLLPPDKHLEVFDGIQFKEQIEVTSTTLDAFFKAKEIPVVDFFHLDVQGAELMVLNGGEEHLGWFKAIWLEVADVEYYQDQAVSAEIDQYLSDRGFVKVVESIEQSLGLGDCLYLNQAAFSDFAKVQRKFLEPKSKKNSWFQKLFGR